MEQIKIAFNTQVENYETTSCTSLGSPKDAHRWISDMPVSVCKSPILRANKSNINGNSLYRLSIRLSIIEYRLGRLLIMCPVRYGYGYLIVSCLIYNCSFVIITAWDPVGKWLIIKNWFRCPISNRILNFFPFYSYSITCMWKHIQVIDLLWLNDTEYIKCLFMIWVPWPLDLVTSLANVFLYLIKWLFPSKLL